MSAFISLTLSLIEFNHHQTLLRTSIYEILKRRYKATHNLNKRNAKEGTHQRYLFNNPEKSKYQVILGLKNPTKEAEAIQ